MIAVDNRLTFEDRSLWLRQKQTSLGAVRRLFDDLSDHTFVLFCKSGLTIMQGSKYVSKAGLEIQRGPGAKYSESFVRARKVGSKLGPAKKFVCS